MFTPKGWFPPGSGICLYPSHRFLATELGVGFDTSPLGIKLLFMGWQTSASGGTLPVAPLWGGNDANTNPGLSSWEIQEVCPRKGGEKDICQSACATGSPCECSLLFVPARL